MAEGEVVETTEQTESVVEQSGEMPEQVQTDETPESAGEDTAATIKRLETALKRANAEAAERRIKLQEFEEEERKRQEAELSETERLRKQLAEAQAASETMAAQVRETQMRSAVERTAARMRFHDPADAYALADLSAVTVGDNGKVDGVEDALKALAKSKPHLVRGAEPANLNAQSRTNGTTAMSDEDAERIGAIYGVRPELVKKASK